MKPELWIFTLSLLGAAWFFASGYFVALAELTLKAGASGEHPEDLPQPDPFFSLNGLMKELARSYRTREILICDSDGLVVHGSSEDSELALRVAGYARGRRMGAHSEADLGIHAIACQVQPLWLVTRGADRKVGEQDLSRVGDAFERYVARVA